MRVLLEDTTGTVFCHYKVIGIMEDHNNIFILRSNDKTTIPKSIIESMEILPDA